MSFTTRPLYCDWYNIVNMFRIISIINTILYPSDQLNKDILYYIIRTYMIYEQQTTFTNIISYRDKCPCVKHSCLIKFWPAFRWNKDKIGYVSFSPIHCEMKNCHTIHYDTNMHKCIYCNNRICSKHCTIIIEQDQRIIICNECK